MLIIPKGQYTSEHQLYTDAFKHWRSKDNGNQTVMFAAVPHAALPVLNDIPRATRLYLYYVFRSSFDTGESWPTVRQCSVDLNLSEKAIESHNKDLVEHGLIARLKKPGRINTSTYLLPIGFNYRLFRSVKELNYLITDTSFSSVYGDVKHFIHMIFMNKDNSYQHYAAVVAEKEILKRDNRLTALAVRLDLPEVGVKAQANDFQLKAMLFKVRDEEFSQFSLMDITTNKIGVVFLPQSKPEPIQNVVEQILKGNLDLYDFTELTTIKVSPGEQPAEELGEQPGEDPGEQPGEDPGEDPCEK